MKVLSSANASIFIAHRKYLRWPMKILAFFWGVFSICGSKYFPCRLPDEIRIEYPVRIKVANTHLQ